MSRSGLLSSFVSVALAAAALVVPAAAQARAHVHADRAAARHVLHGKVAGAKRSVDITPHVYVGSHHIGGFF